jgi:hypothetical protein
MPVRTPNVKLGEVTEGSVAPAIMAIVDRGARQRPELTEEIRADVELNIDERYPSVEGRVTLLRRFLGVIQI